MSLMRTCLECHGTGAIDDRYCSCSAAVALRIQTIPGLKEIQDRIDRILDEAPVSGLFESAPVPSELQAGEDDPRPGWSIDGLHRFTQDETDTLIRAELVSHGGFSEVMGERDIRVAMLGEPHGISYTNAYESAQRGRHWRSAAFAQRGGIDTDRDVRRMAFRAWGDRDRARGGIDALVEKYRVKLGLQPWAEHADNARNAYLKAIAPGQRVDHNRRSGRTTHGILTTLAKCEAWGISRVMLNETEFACRFVYSELMKRATNLGIGVAIGVADVQDRRGVGPYIAHVDHFELETRRDPADRWLGWQYDQVLIDEAGNYPSRFE